MQRTSAKLQRLPPTRAALVRIGALVLIVVVASLIGYQLGWFDYQHTLQHVERLRRAHSFPVFVVTFVVAFGVLTSLGIPGLPVTVVGGVLFGTLLGSVLSWVGVMISAVSGYWIARTVGHGVVSRWLKRFRRVDAAVTGASDFDGMLRLRLIPVLPLGAANFAGGLARAPFWLYLGATAIGVIPSTVIYTYFADSLMERVGGGGGGAAGKTTAWWSVIIASALLMLLTFAPKLFGRRSGESALSKAP